MARESIEQALPDSNLSIHPVQTGAGYRATRSANRLVFCDSLMELFQKRVLRLALHRQPLRERRQALESPTPLVQIDQIRTTGNSGVIGNECLS
jgi:hypothetical protein